jgi:fatty acid desaturase
MPSAAKLVLASKHGPHWRGTLTWLGFAVAFFSMQGLLWWSLFHDHVWTAMALILILSHLMHAHLIAFHEAAHGSLCPDRWINDILGRFVGLFSFMSLALYRAVHYFHHTYLATERDEELWPFVIPGSPRWLRCLIAGAELAGGLFYTPVLFLRSFLRPGSPVTNRAVRVGVWLDLAFLATVWTIVLAVVAWTGTWYYLLLMYFIPAMLAGSMQSFRKYVEHMGLSGSTVLGSTRSVVSPTRFGRLLAFSLFNEPFHGVHHRYAHLPQDVMPEFVSLLIPTEPDEPQPYASYRQAIWDMAKSLPDPRVGAQWQRNGDARFAGSTFDSGLPSLKPSELS